MTTPTPSDSFASSAPVTLSDEEYRAMRAEQFMSAHREDLWALVNRINGTEPPPPIVDSYLECRQDELEALRERDASDAWNLDNWPPTEEERGIDWSRE